MVADADIFRAQGVSGLNQWSGYVDEETEPQLKGTNWFRTIHDMVDNDPVIGAICFAIVMLIRQVDWDIVPASQDDQEALDNAAFVHQCMFEDMNFQDTLTEILTFLWNGWAVLEPVYMERLGSEPPEISLANGSRRRMPASKFDDGKIGWKGWYLRAQESLQHWIFDGSDPVAMVQLGPSDYEPHTISLDKAFLFRTSSIKNNPEGRSILRNAWRPWRFKKQIENIEGIGIERDLAGLPTFGAPPELFTPGASASDKAILIELQKIVKSIKRDQNEGIVYPLVRDDKGNKKYELGLMSSGGQRQFDTDKIINRYDSRIAMSVLMDWVIIGHERVGSFALVSSKTDITSITLAGWIRMITEVVNSQAIPRLMKVNGMDQSKAPRLQHGDIETIDLGELGSYIQALTAAGFSLFPNPAIEKYVLQQAGLPVPNDYEVTRQKEIDQPAVPERIATTE